MLQLARFFGSGCKTLSLFTLTSFRLSFGGVHFILADHVRGDLQSVHLSIMQQTLPAEAFLQCNDCNVNVCKVPNMLAARSSKASIVFATIPSGGNIMCPVSLARYANTC